MDELRPILQELVGQPVAFMGGLVSGLLRLNLNEDPLKSWLEKQGASPASTTANGQNNKNSGPQSISID
ncbi:MAG: hypothetical protein HC856_03825 [Pseudanabaena sp. RU_4_16]|nr:hypothetical protein [Pseudanabaena sp. SU_2_4]NJM27573.1 hypothetical protein [Pseudanabaena sp. RU_4_16]